MHETQKFRSVGSSSKRAIPLERKEDTDNDVQAPNNSRYKSVLRKETSTDRTQYPPEGDTEEPLLRIEILWRLIIGRTKTTETWQNEDGMLDVEKQDYREEEMWVEGYKVQEDRGYASNENDCTKQEHIRHREVLCRAKKNTCGTLEVSEKIRGRANAFERRNCTRIFGHVAG